MADNPLSKQEIIELRQLVALLGKDIKGIDLENLIKSGSAARELLKSLQKESQNLDNDFIDLSATLRNITKDLDKQTKISKDINNSFKSLTNLSDKLKYDQEDISRLSLNELKNVNDKIKIEINKLGVDKTGLEVLKAKYGLSEKEEAKLLDLENKKKEGTLWNIKQKELLLKLEEKRKHWGDEEQSQLNELNGLYKDQNGVSELILGTDQTQLNYLVRLQAAAKERLRTEDKIQKSLGLTGTVLKGISKIPLLGDLPGIESALEVVEERIREIEKETGKVPTKFESTKLLLGEVGKSVVQNLKDPLAIAGLAAGALYEVIKHFKDELFEVDKQTGELAKGFNVTYDQAVNIREELNKMANSGGDFLLTTKALQESLISIGDTLGSNAKLNRDDLQTFTDLREAAGLTNEELSSLEKTSLAFGGTLKDNTSKILAQAKITSLQNGVLLNEKIILKDVSKLSASILVSFQGNPVQLANAVAQAKALGLSLEAVDKTADSFLNFESSISSEIEAQLITGKNINLEQARYYALTNNLAGLTEEIAKNVGTASDYTHMNRLAQEALAKSVGMTRDEIANMLVDREALAKYSGKDADKAKEALDAARARGLTNEQIGKTSIDNLIAQQDIQDKFNKSVENLKETFVSIAQGPLKSISDIMSTLIKHTAAIKVGLVLAVGAATALGIGMAVVAANSIAAAVGGTGGLAAIGIVAGLAAAASAYALFKSSVTEPTQQIHDGIINEQGGLVVSGPKGSIQLNKSDKIVAGTNLGGGGNDKHYEKMTKLLETIANKDLAVYNDYVKINTANQINSYRSL